MNEIAHVGELGYELVDFKKGFLSKPDFGSVIEQWVSQYYESGLSPEDYLKKNEEKIDRIVAKVKKANMFVTPTLIVPKIVEEQVFEKDLFLKRTELKYLYKGFMSEYLAGQNPYNLQISRICKKMANQILDKDCHNFYRAFYGSSKLFVKNLHDSGVPLLLSTDTPALTVAVVLGFSAMEELQNYVDLGFSPYEAIKTGTYNAGLESLPLIFKSSLSEELYKLVLNKSSVEELNKKYSDIKRDSSSFYSVEETELNDLGYKLLNQSLYKESIEIFRINTIEFPKSFNSFDSLGEAYMKAGKKEEAIKNYQKSIELNPNNNNGIKMLKKLK